MGWTERTTGWTEPSRDREGAGQSGRNARRALRLGLRMVNGLRRRNADAIVEAVKRFGAFASIFDLWRASEVSAAALRLLAQADAFRSMGLDRQHALWEVQRLHGKPLPLFDGLPERRGFRTKLPSVSLADDVLRDYCSVGLSLKAHPMSFLRPVLTARRVITAAEAKDENRSPLGRIVSAAGLVLFRQRPGTAKGVMFMTIEDETARLDLIIRPDTYERCRDALDVRMAACQASIRSRWNPPGFVPLYVGVVDFLTRNPGDLSDFAKKNSPIPISPCGSLRANAQWPATIHHRLGWRIRALPVGRPKRRRSTRKRGGDT